MSDLVSRFANLSLEQRKLVLRKLHERGLAAQQPALDHAGQGPISGPIPLTVDQSWFLNHQELMDPRQRWNVASMLNVRPGLDVQLMERVVAQLLRHHDALRSRFAHDAGGWRACLAPPAGPPPFTVVDLSRVADGELRCAIEQTGDVLQGRLDVIDGPLVQLAYFDCGPDRPGRLLLFAHHLAADGYSLMILLGDLHTGYQQLARGEAIQLPPKTTSIEAWAERINAYARSAELQAQLAYWCQLPWDAVPSLPLDFPDRLARTTNGSYQTVEGALGVDETQLLLRVLPLIDQAQMADALVMALVETLTQWTRGDWAEVVMVDTGRDIAPVSDDLDLSRTVGWLAISRLLVLARPAADSPSAALRATLAQLRSIPGGGFGYHVLRFLSPDPQVVQRLAPLRKNEVLFNYFGSIQQALPDDPIFVGPAVEQGGRIRNPDDRAFNLLTITAMIIQNQLLVRWSYSASTHRRETIERLAKHLLRLLRTLASDSKGLSKNT